MKKYKVTAGQTVYFTYEIEVKAKNERAGRKNCIKQTNKRMGLTKNLGMVTH
jgi:hypothetical protein